MNGLWIRALLVALITASPIAVATAQEAPKTEEEKTVDPGKTPPKAEEPDDDKKTEEEEKKEEAPAETPKPSEPPAAPPSDQPAVPPSDQPAAPPSDQPGEQPKPAAQPAEQPKEEAKPTEQPKELPQPAAPADAPAATPIEKTSPKSTVAPQVTATAETKPDAAVGKPWKVKGDLSFSVGSAMFHSNPTLRKPSLGWLLDASGSYTVTKLLDANLDVFARITMDQVLTNTVFNSAVGQTRQYEFFFRDVRLGLAAPSIYKEQLTGITVSPSVEFFLPTSKTSIAAKRWFHFGLNLRLGRTFEKLGPGDLAIGLGSTFRKPFATRETDPESQYDGDVVGGNDPADNCRAWGDVNGVAERLHASCGSSKNSNFTFINDVSISYTWGPVTAAISYAIYSARYFRSDLGPDPSGLTVGSSPYSSDNTWSNLSLGSISVSYTITDNFSASAAFSTFQSPYWDNSQLRPPFWDPKGENLTTLDLGVAFVY